MQNTKERNQQTVSELRNTLWKEAHGPICDEIKGLIADIREKGHQLAGRETTHSKTDIVAKYLSSKFTNFMTRLQTNCVDKMGANIIDKKRSHVIKSELFEDVTKIWSTFLDGNDFTRIFDYYSDKNKNYRPKGWRKDSQNFEAIFESRLDNIIRILLQLVEKHR